MARRHGRDAAAVAPALDPWPAVDWWRRSRKPSSTAPPGVRRGSMGALHHTARGSIDGVCFRPAVHQPPRFGGGGRGMIPGCGFFFFLGRNGAPASRAVHGTFFWVKPAAPFGRRSVRPTPRPAAGADDPLGVCFATCLWAGGGEAWRVVACTPGWPCRLCRVAHGGWPAAVARRAVPRRGATTPVPLAPYRQCPLAWCAQRTSRGMRRPVSDAGRLAAASMACPRAGGPRRYGGSEAS